MKKKSSKATNFAQEEVGGFEVAVNDGGHRAVQPIHSLGDLQGEDQLPEEGDLHLRVAMQQRVQIALPRCE